MILGHPRFELLSQMLDGMLNLKVHARLQHHLERCPSCAKLQEGLARVRKNLRSLTAIEERLVGPSLPLFLEGVPRHLVFPVRPVLGGVLLGMAALTLFLFFRAPAPAMRVISGSPTVLNPEGVARDQLRPEDAIRTLHPGQVDLELPNRALLRLKPGTIITWQEARRFWFYQKPRIMISLLRGELLVRTRDTFWGSQMDIHTPTASATVKGTAFSLQVNPPEDTTTLKVLAGSVFFSPHLGGVGVEVESGRSSRIRAERLPSLPQKMTPQEIRGLLETYWIGQLPPAAVVIGGGPERVEELFKPALLYVGQQGHPQIHPFMLKTVRELNAAILSGNPQDQRSAVKFLEMSLNGLTDPDMAVPFLLFAGAYSSKVGEPLLAMNDFRRVTEEFSQHPLASLALAALGFISERQLKDPELARGYYENLLKRYPRSPEAAAIRKRLED